MVNLLVLSNKKNVFIDGTRALTTPSSVLHDGVIFRNRDQNCQKTFNVWKVLTTLHMCCAL